MNFYYCPVLRQVCPVSFQPLNDVKPSYAITSFAYKQVAIAGNLFNDI